MSNQTWVTAPSKHCIIQVIDLNSKTIALPHFCAQLNISEETALQIIKPKLYTKINFIGINKVGFITFSDATILLNKFTTGHTYTIVKQWLNDQIQPKLIPITHQSNN